MSRAGYTYSGADTREEMLAQARYRGQVASAIRGKRGQAFLRELLAAVDLAERDGIEFTTGVLVLRETIGGEPFCAMCALGAVLHARGEAVPPGEAEASDYDWFARHLDIAEPLAREVMFENDEGAGSWSDIRRWAKSLLREARA